jgi:hypothetical protein
MQPRINFTLKFQGCESASNRDQCICTAANYEIMDACITCMVIEAKGRDAAVGLIDGTDGTSAELVEQTGEEVKDRECLDIPRSLLAAC